MLRLEATGPVVGLLKGIGFEQAECAFEPGDLFLAYTDGVSEAMTTDDEERGEERLIAAAQEASVTSSTRRTVSRAAPSSTMT